jgi:hypothetical protein
MMIPIAPSEVAASVNFAFVDIMNMKVAMWRQLQQDLATLREGASASRISNGALGPHDLAVTINIHL